MRSAGPPPMVAVATSDHASSPVASAPPPSYELLKNFEQDIGFVLQDVRTKETQLREFLLQTSPRFRPWCAAGTAGNADSVAPQTDHVVGREPPLYAASAFLEQQRLLRLVPRAVAGADDSEDEDEDDSEEDEFPSDDLLRLPLPFGHTLKRARIAEICSSIPTTARNIYDSALYYGVAGRFAVRYAGVEEGLGGDSLSPRPFPEEGGEVGVGTAGTRSSGKGLFFYAGSERAALGFARDKMSEKEDDDDQKHIRPTTSTLLAQTPGRCAAAVDVGGEQSSLAERCLSSPYAQHLRFLDPKPRTPHWYLFERQVLGEGAGSCSCTASSCFNYWPRPHEPNGFVRVLRVLRKIIVSGGMDGHAERFLDVVATPGMGQTSSRSAAAISGMLCEVADADRELAVRHLAEWARLQYVEWLRRKFADVDFDTVVDSVLDQPGRRGATVVERADGLFPRWTGRGGQDGEDEGEDEDGAGGGEDSSGEEPSPEESQAGDEEVVAGGDEYELMSEEGAVSAREATTHDEDVDVDENCFTMSAGSASDLIDAAMTPPQEDRDHHADHDPAPPTFQVEMLAALDHGRENFQEIESPSPSEEERSLVPDIEVENILAPASDEEDLESARGLYLLLRHPALAAPASDEDDPDTTRRTRQRKKCLLRHLRAYAALQYHILLRSAVGGKTAFRDLAINYILDHLPDFFDDYQTFRFETSFWNNRFPNFQAAKLLGLEKWDAGCESALQRVLQKCFVNTRSWDDHGGESEPPCHPWRDALSMMGREFDRWPHCLWWRDALGRTAVERGRERLAEIRRGGSPSGGGLAQSSGGSLAQQEDEEQQHDRPERNLLPPNRPHNLPPQATHNLPVSGSPRPAGGALRRRPDEENIDMTEVHSNSTLNEEISAEQHSHNVVQLASSAAITALQDRLQEQLLHDQLHDQRLLQLHLELVEGVTSFVKLLAWLWQHVPNPVYRYVKLLGLNEWRKISLDRNSMYWTLIETEVWLRRLVPEVFLVRRGGDNMEVLDRFLEARKVKAKDVGKEGVVGLADLLKEMFGEG